MTNLIAVYGSDLQFDIDDKKIPILFPQKVTLNIFFVVLFNKLGIKHIYISYRLAFVGIFILL